MVAINTKDTVMVLVLVLVLIAVPRQSSIQRTSSISDEHNEQLPTT